jgi:hypothetical protein
MEEQKINTTISPISNIKSSSYLNCSSSKNIFKVNKFNYLDFDDKLNFRKKYNSKDKIIYNENKNVNNNINKIKDGKNIIKTCEVKINNFISNKTIDTFNNKLQCKDTNLSIPVNTNPNSNNKEKYISKQKQSLKLKAISNKIKDEIFSQNIDVINSMKEKPPKLPELFSHDYTFSDKFIEKSNETFGKLNRETIPVAFYNHLVFNEENKKLVNNKHKYCRTSLTQRNKNKMLTVIYYSP